MRCIKCELHKSSKQVVLGLGPPNAKIMIVGMCPGVDEDNQGEPFVGGAGRVLGALLKEAGIRRSECYITNVCKCHPPSNRAPLPEEVEACLSYLEEEIRVVKPNIIIAFGDLPLRVLTSKTGITNWRGSIMPSKYHIKALPTFHPAYLMRGNQHYWSTVLRDLTLVKEQSEFPEIRKESVCYEIYDPATHSDAWIESNLLNVSNPISFDIETPGVLKPWKGPVIGCAFGYAHGRSIHFNMRLPSHYATAKRVLEGPAPKIVQRGTFDWMFLKYHGIHTNNLAFDTKIAQHFLAPNLPNSLAYLASVHTDVNFYKPAKGPGGGVIDMTPAELAEYNNIDGDVTRRIYFPLKKELEESGMTAIFDKNIALIKTLSKMMLRGVKINLKAVSDEVEMIKAKNDAFENMFMDKGINIRSSAQIGELLFDLGFPLQRTPSGKQYKVNAEVLSKIDHPLAKKLLQFRELDKLRSTFLESMPAHLVLGRVHTTYEITGTVTGRLASKDPNLMNIPRRTRHIFIPDGGLFVEADYSQFELRIIAALITMWCNDDTLERDLADGVNIHLMICQEVYKKEDVNDKELLRAKAAVFGTVYGRSAISLAREFKVSNVEAERIQHTILGRYQGIGKYHDLVGAIKEVRSAYGRLKQVGSSTSINELFNFPVQSTAGETLKDSLTLLDERLEEPDALALTVHDNLIVDTSENNKHNVIALVKEVMERPIPELENRRFPCKITTGINWRDLKKI